MDTREKILETATRLFSTQGFANTSLSQVAKEAQVSKALIFWHFENKETLFRTALQRTLEPYFINVAGDLEGLSEVDQIKRLIDEYYAFVSRNMYSVKFLMSLILREETHPDDVVGHMNELHRVYRNLLADILDSGRQKGVFKPTVNPRLDASIILTALHGLLVQGFMGGDAANEAPAVQVVTPSSHRPLAQVPGSQTEQVTKPLFLPQVERAAQRTTLPLQFTSRSPLDTASFTACATQLTCWPWFPVQGHDARMSSRTAGASGSVHAARAGEVNSAMPPASTRPRTSLRMGLLLWGCLSPA